LNRKTSGNSQINQLFEKGKNKSKEGKVNGLERFQNIKCGKTSLAVNKT
jgi:hypothetical protein